MQSRIARIAPLALPIIVLACVLLAPMRAATAAEPYRSAMREQCEQELAKDKGWQAELRNDMRPEVHQEDANIMLKNKKHVVMAYAALWALTAGFLVLLWLRQRRLLADMERLGQQINKAAAE
jgi:hypothetical protein